MKRVAVEEHFSTEDHLNLMRSILDKNYPIPEVIQEEKILQNEVPFMRPPATEAFLNRLLDIGEGRLKVMDDDGIDMQVLSLVSPGVQIFDPPTGTALAKKVNEQLAEAVQRNPKRLAGFASIAPQSPNDAADELERAVNELGLKGVSINSHTKGEYLDNKKYWVILERAEKLGASIYIHPRSPSPAMVEPYLEYPALATAMCGFATEVALHALRLICSGVFDQFPKLTIILGHLGEALPYWLWRLDNMWRKLGYARTFKKLPSEYFSDNFYITTSGMFWVPPLLCSCLAVGTDRILFAVDYPMESNSKAVQFMQEAPLCDADKEKILHLNAEKILAL